MTNKPAFPQIQGTCSMCGAAHPAEGSLHCCWRARQWKRFGWSSALIYGAAAVLAILAYYSIK